MHRGAHEKNSAHHPIPVDWLLYRVAALLRLADPWSFQSGDVKTLNRKIDFPSVRSSLRPTVERKIGERAEAFKAGSGAAGALLGSMLQGDILKQASKAVLDHLVTAENIVRLSRESGTLAEKIDRLVSQQFGQIPDVVGSAQGGEQPVGRGDVLGQAGNFAKRFGLNVPGAGGGASNGAASDAPRAPPAAAKPAAAKEPASFGLGNIKSFALDGPLGFRIGVARDASSDAADVTARIGFQDFDWKLTGLEPNLK